MTNFLEILLHPNLDITARIAADGDERWRGVGSWWLYLAPESSRVCSLLASGLFICRVNWFHFPNCSLGQVFSNVQQKYWNRGSPGERPPHIFVEILLLFNVKTLLGSYSCLPRRRLWRPWEHRFPWSSLLRVQGNQLWYIKDVLT